MFSHIRAGWPRRAGLVLPAAATLLAWLLPVFAWAPLTYPGYFQFLNGYSAIFNLDDFVRSRAPLAWAPPVGQAYDLLRSEGRLPYALAAFPRALGWDNASAVKLMMAAAILAGALGVYGWARRRLGDWPALLAACVYAFWPFALSTVYVRGAFAETLLLGLLPFALWCADAAPEREPGWPPVIGLAALLAAAIWTQAGLALWLAAALLVYLLLREGDRHVLSTLYVPVTWVNETFRPGAKAGPYSTRRFRPFAGWLAGIATGLLGLLPVVLAHGAAGRSYVDFAGQFLDLSQLLPPGWGLVPAPAGAAPVSLGLAGCALAVIGVLLSKDVGAVPPLSSDVGAIPPWSPGRKTIWFACACVLLPAALSLGLAAPFWRLPFLAWTLTYPWQLLLLAGPWLAWLSGLGGLSLARLLPVPPNLESSISNLQSRAEGPLWAISPVALFAPLIVLALLAVYGGLNPTAAPAPVSDRPVAVFGDNQIALVTAVISDTVPAGDRASVRVEWQALRPLDQDYTVFFHAEGPDGTVYGQQDTMPRAGKAPTSGWQAGAVISDTYTLTLKPGAPMPSRYVLGLYQWQTGARLAAGSDNQVVLNAK